MLIGKLASRTFVFGMISSFFGGVTLTLAIQRVYFADDPLPSVLAILLFCALAIFCMFVMHLQSDDMDDELKRARTEKERRIAEFKALLAEEADTPQPCGGKGLPSVVCLLRREGKDEKEIAAYLSDKGQWCSNPQIGALLHENTQVSGVTSDTMTKYAQRLLDKA